MPQTDPVPKDFLSMALQLAIGLKGENADWVSNPEAVNEFIESVAKKLQSLNQGRA
jgi:hypothetical protein